jgi:hypothetical protein
VSFYNAKCNCEHCNIERYRKEVFILEDENGNYIQVGKSCLKDYVGNKNFSEVFFKFSIISDLTNFANNDNSSFNYSNNISTNFAIEIAMSIILNQGFVSKTKALENDLTPTSINMILYFSGNNEEYRNEINKVNLKYTAHDVIDFINNIDEDSNYYHNLKIFINNSFCDFKKFGFIAAAANEFIKSKNEVNKKCSTSSYIGNIGDKVKDINTKLIFTKKMESYYGVVTFYKFEDNNGNIINWFSSKDINIDVGNNYIISGTIKDLKDFNGNKETQLIRVKTK